jgi:hypothetical protein
MLRVSSGFEAWVKQEIFMVWHWLDLRKQNWAERQFCANRRVTNRRNRAGGEDHSSARTSGFVRNCRAKLARKAVLRSALRLRSTTPSRRRGSQFRTNLWLRAELPSKTGQEGSFALSVASPINNTEQEARTTVPHEPLASCGTAKQNWPGGQFCAQISNCPTAREWHGCQTAPYRSADPVSA